MNAAILITNYYKERVKEKIGKLNIICTIQYQSINRTEHFKFAEAMHGKMRFFNIYDLIARDFIIKHPITKYLPKGMLDYQQGKLAADTRLMNIFVGFGKTNKQILAKTICNNQMLDHDYQALIFDQNIAAKKLEFEHLARGIFGNLELDKNYTYLESPQESYDIKFIKENVLTKKFYDEITKAVLDNSFTQIIISLGSDKINLETALEIRQRIYEIEVLDKAKIFAVQKEETYSEDSLNLFNENYSKRHQILFVGSEKAIINNEVLINEKFDYLAKRVAGIYEKSRSTAKNESEVWNSFSIFTQESNRMAAYGIRIKLNLIGLDIVEEEGEGISEEEYFESYQLSDIERDLLKQSEQKYVEIFLRDENKKIKNNVRNNLARLEHLRWNAVHLVNGWTKLPLEKIYVKEVDKSGQVHYQIVRKNESLKQHACITSFEGLDVLTQVSLEKFAKYDLDQDYLLKECETIRFDYSLMDNLFEKIIYNSPYKIIRKRD